MTNAERAGLLRDLRWHLDMYRQKRSGVGLAAARGEILDEGEKKALGFHAFRLAETIDRLNGSTR